MTDIKLNIRTTLEKNAERYFETAKKFRSKINGINEVITKFTARLATLETEHAQTLEHHQRTKQPSRPKEWYEKFRWFVSSEGFLCIGGRDATSNDIVVKKHADKDDLVFHTEAASSPFFVIKTNSKKPGDATIKECAQATITYSRAWKLGLATTDVYWVSTAQLSKQTETGEYVQKGGFIVRGKRNKVQTSIELAVGITNDAKIMAGPPSAIQKNCTNYVFIEQGADKATDAAKKIRHLLGGGDLSDIITVLPSGEYRVLRKK